MSEQKGLVTFKGNPLTLVGDQVKIGQKAPEFVAIDNNLLLSALHRTVEKSASFLASFLLTLRYVISRRRSSTKRPVGWVRMLRS